MEDEDRTVECQYPKPSAGTRPMASVHEDLQEERVMNLKGVDANEPTEGSNLLNSSEKKPQESPTEPNSLQRLRRILACPPHGLLGRVVTNGTMVVLLWAVVWSVTGSECLPGGNLFGIIILFYCAVTGGKLFGLIKFPTLPPLPPLLGMLLAGFLLRNIPIISENVQIQHKWSSSLRSIALSVILVRAGLGLDSKALRKLKGVCVRLAMGPCIVEACASALLSHFLMGLPWQWGFILGFVLGAVSPAVVVPSMLLLQGGGYGVEKGIPTLLMAAGSFDDILAITGFNTCLGVAFSMAGGAAGAGRGAGGARLAEDGKMAALGSPARTLRGLLRELRYLSAAAGRPYRDTAAYRYLLRAFRAHRVTSEKLCRAQHELHFQAATYLCLLRSIRQHVALHQEFHGKGERSVEESAGLVGLQLPRQPGGKGWEP